MRGAWQVSATVAGPGGLQRRPKTAGRCSLPDWADGEPGEAEEADGEIVEAVGTHASSGLREEGDELDRLAGTILWRVCRFEFTRRESVAVAKRRLRSSFPAHDRSATRQTRPLTRSSSLLHPAFLPRANSRIPNCSPGCDNDSSTSLKTDRIQSCVRLEFVSECRADDASSQVLFVNPAPNGPSTAHLVAAFLGLSRTARKNVQHVFVVGGGWWSSVCSPLVIFCDAPQADLPGYTFASFRSWSRSCRRHSCR